MPYRAPLGDIQFILDQVVPLAPVAATGRYAEATPDLVEAILTEAARLCDTVMAPLQRAGDLHPARLENGAVRSTPGFAEAFRQIAEGGWIGVSAPVEHGGMGLPQALNMAIHDMMSGACLALGLNPLLTQGQIEALDHHANAEMKALYLPKLISGEWSGTMNLTEPQAGSDVGALRTKAEANGDGTYAVTGQKIFISWGDCDMTENVCHLVLARLPGAPAGTKGISLFLVPKFIPDANGKPGIRNGVNVVSLEHKLGLHGSPTCVMDYDRATGWLVGAEQGGMAAMFTMMNNARLAVGVQGVGVAEAACQAAASYAADRRQMGPIIDHPDVRRMLATMRAEVFAARAIALACATATDMAQATGEGDWHARAALLTPIAKAYGTDVGCDVASMAMQVHGGMGYVEETGVAQFWRDVRVTAIYEGTNGIQAMDLVGRKMMDGGEAAYRLLEEIEAGAEAARARLPDLAGNVWSAAETLREATEAMTGRAMPDRYAGAVPYLRAFARVLGAHFHLRAAVAEGGQGPRSALARVHIDRLLPQFAACLAEARDGAGALFDLTPEALAS
ncbi:MAG: acyl-CoA dehydrogenase [Rhodobacteraceae bacterium]|jgi:alkylation response protein AidB-like acyl-CoA dehydrogenase|uniref:acyl-CoA dehydrogenase n=1 Tax=Albidovulum sp. TaxID=1872424 RepID=UPI00265AB331|nr:acyl-CoA dehydrogenase [uncultured Defluviimonas sp.]MCC0071329.1 acyl-CoA dehydrogenase [Paracoccaceae bacterium]